MASQVDETNSTELQLKFNYRQAEGQKFIGSAHFPLSEEDYPEVYQPQFIRRSFYITIPSVDGMAVKDFGGAKVHDFHNLGNYDQSSGYYDYDYYETLLGQFGINDDDSFNLQSIDIPVFTKGLSWYVDDSDSNSPAVSTTKDSFITIPSLNADIHYNFISDKINATIKVTRANPITYEVPALPPQEIVDPSNPDQAARISEEAEDYYNDHPYDTVYEPVDRIFPGYLISNYDKEGNPLKKVTISFSGEDRPDSENEFHQIIPVVWLRVDDSYAKAHNKEVRKLGCYYYKNDGQLEANPLDWDYDPLASIYSVNDAEYRFDIDDFKDFKNAIDQLVNERYGGYDVPLNVPLNYKWSTQHLEHVGNNYALNIFVHSKGVL